MYQGGGTNGLRPQTMTKQWLALVRPVLEYGCELWEGEISETKSNEIEVIQNKFCRAALGTRVLVAAVADLGLSSLKSHRQVIKLGY